MLGSHAYFVSRCITLNKGLKSKSTNSVIPVVGKYLYNREKNLTMTQQKEHLKTNRTDVNLKSNWERDLSIDFITVQLEVYQKRTCADILQIVSAGSHFSLPIIHSFPLKRSGKLRFKKKFFFKRLSQNILLCLLLPEFSSKFLHQKIFF